MSFTEMKGSPKERIGTDGLSIVRRFRGPYSERFDFISTLPFVYPVLAFQNATLDEISMEPVDCPDLAPDLLVATQVNGAGVVEIEVTYALNASENSGDGQSGGGQSNGKRFTKEKNEDGTTFELNVDSELEVFTTKGQGMIWELTGPGLGIVFKSTDGMPVRQPIQKYEIRWGNVQRPPFQYWNQLAGTTNNVEVTLPLCGIVCPPETVRFEKYRVSTKFSAENFLDPVLLWNLDVSFAVKNILQVPVITNGAGEAISSDGTSVVCGWNHFYRDTPKPGWERLKYFNGGQYAYPSASWVGFFTQV